MGGRGSVLLNSILLFFTASVITPLRAMVALDMILGGSAIMALTLLPPRVPRRVTVRVSFVGDASRPASSIVDVVRLKRRARPRGQYLSFSDEYSGSLQGEERSDEWGGLGYYLEQYIYIVQFAVFRLT